jgi:hypothetical protein
MRRSMILFALAAVAAALPAQANAQRYTVRCESRGDRRETCRADTSGGVQLVRRLSDSPCREGSSWGVERGGIWVSRGCRGEFALGRGRGYGGDDGYSRGGYGGGGYGNGNNGDGGYGKGRNGNGGYSSGDNRGRYGDGRYSSGDDRGRYGNGRWASQAESQCRRAVERYLDGRNGRGYGNGYGNVETWIRREHGNSVDVDWRAGRNRSGSCSVDSNGRTRVHLNGGGLLGGLRGR